VIVVWFDRIRKRIALVEFVREFYGVCVWCATRSYGSADSAKIEAQLLWGSLGEKPIERLEIQVALIINFSFKQERKHPKLRSRHGNIFVANAILYRIGEKIPAQID
jgi:hypothetical protein